MNYVASRRRPRDIIEYVCTHALTQETQATQNEESKEEQAKGTTGFLCWQTDKMKSIVQYEFKRIGDFQTKLRSGAFASKNISFDMDTGNYKEYSYRNTENITEKQEKALDNILKGKDGVQSFTRVFMKPISNQKFTNGCPIAQPLTGDQSRGYLNQNSGGQNTFNDQIGVFTFYPQFKFRAGDILDCKISQIKDQENAQGGYDKKHSGKYVMKSISHTFFADGRAYSKVVTIRSTTQQDETTAAKS